MPELSEVVAKDYLPGEDGFNYLLKTKDPEMLTRIYRIVRDVIVTCPRDGDIIFGFICSHTHRFIMDSEYKNEYDL